MDLLEKASVILTPTAYNNGEALCVKPSDGSGDFDFSRNSAATRVNAQGLVENVQILSSNLVQNPSFSEEGVQEVSNGSFSQEGSDIIVNGDFATDSNWDGQATISNGQLTKIDNGLVRQYTLDVSVKSYKVIVDVDTFGAGLTVYLGGTNKPLIEGVNTIYMQSGGSNSLVGFNNGSGSIINSISIVEVGQDWTLGTGWSIGEDKAVCDGTQTANSLIYQSGVLASADSFKCEITISDYQSGVLRFVLGGGGSEQSYSANGTYTFYGTKGSDNNLYLSANADFIGSITNISVKEVGMDWDFGTDVVIGDSVVKMNNSAALQGAIQTNVITSGNLCKVSFEVKNYVNGIVNLRHPLSENVSANGVYTFVGNANDTKVFIRGADTTNNFEITNISIIEISSDTNLPRINYEGFSFDGSGNIIPNSGCGSWLFESQSTNLITQSELFSDAYWTKSGSSITSNAIISPDGTLNSDKLVEDNTNGNHFIFRSQSSFTPSVDYTQSWFVKAGEKYKVRIQDAADGDYFGAYNLTTGALIDEGTNSVGGTTITELSNGWYRLTLVSNQGTGSRYPAIILLPNSYTAGDGIGYQGDGTSGVYIWGAQLEQQSYATSYIPTNGEANGVTRNQDVCTGGGSLATINSTEGTLYFEGSALSDDATFKRISIGTSDGNFVNNVGLRYNTNGTSITYQYRVGSVYQAELFANINQTDVNKIACVWKVNRFELWVNGVKAAEDISGSVVPANALNSIFYGKTSTLAEPLYGKTKALAVWKEALSDQELTALTTI